VTAYLKIIRIMSGDASMVFPKHDNNPPFLYEWFWLKGPLYEAHKIRANQTGLGGSKSTVFQKDALKFCGNGKTESTVSYISKVTKQCECGFDIPVGSRISKNNGFFYFYHAAQIHMKCHRSARGTRFKEGEFEQDQKRNQERSEFFRKRRSI